jgi:hypothetical protein
MSVSSDKSRMQSHLVELCDKLGVPLALFPKQVVLLLLEAVSKDKQLLQRSLKVILKESKK